jgi:hypothetical protein
MAGEESKQSFCRWPFPGLQLPCRIQRSQHGYHSPLTKGSDTLLCFLIGFTKANDQVGENMAAEEGDRGLSLPDNPVQIPHAQIFAGGLDIELHFCNAACRQPFSGIDPGEDRDSKGDFKFLQPPDDLQDVVLFFPQIVKAMMEMASMRSATLSTKASIAPVFLAN